MMNPFPDLCHCNLKRICMAKHRSKLMPGSNSVHRHHIKQDQKTVNFNVLNSISKQKGGHRASHYRVDFTDCDRLGKEVYLTIMCRLKNAKRLDPRILVYETAYK